MLPGLKPVEGGMKPGWPGMPAVSPGAAPEVPPVALPGLVPGRLLNCGGLIPGWIGLWKLCPGLSPVTGLMFWPVVGILTGETPKPGDRPRPGLKPPAPPILGMPTAHAGRAMPVMIRRLKAIKSKLHIIDLRPITSLSMLLQRSCGYKSG